MTARDEQRAAFLEALKTLIVAAQSFRPRELAAARANAIAIYDRATRSPTPDPDEHDVLRSTERL